MSLMCKLGLHKWRYENTYNPRFNATILVEVIDRRICSRCEKTETTFHYKDWEVRSYDWEDGKLKNLDSLKDDPDYEYYKNIEAY